MWAEGGCLRSAIKSLAEHAECAEKKQKNSVISVGSVRGKVEVHGTEDGER